MSPLYMGTPYYYCGRPSNTPVIASSSVLCHVPASPHREGIRRTKKMQLHIVFLMY